MRYREINMSKVMKGCTYYKINCFMFQAGLYFYVCRTLVNLGVSCSQNVIVVADTATVWSSIEFRTMLRVICGIWCILMLVYVWISGWFATSWFPCKTTCNGRCPNGSGGQYDLFSDTDN